MTDLTPTYNQGDIVVVDFPFTDISQTKKRSALVLSNQTVNQTGDYLLVMITSQVKYDGLSLLIASTDYADKPLPLTSFIRVHKVFLLNESLISYRFSAVTTSLRQTVARQLAELMK